MGIVESLPAVNAALNGTAALLLTAGFAFIRRRKIKAHRRCMVSAFVVSAVFLVSYVLHKYLTGGVHTSFGGEGVWRTVYYAMLISHVVLAMAIVPLALTTLTLAARGAYEKHRAWARWTFPIWYYVSITGVLIYCFLYQWF